MVFEIIGIGPSMILMALFFAAKGAGMNVIRVNLTDMVRALGPHIAQSDGKGRRCVYCTEEIPRDTTYCPYCGSRADHP